jgi:glutathione reductase (NADPH)
MSTASTTTTSTTATAATATAAEGGGTSYDYDLICIGGGSAGIACAKRASSLHGRKVLCIERGVDRLGGTCVNVGCVPKKVMFGAANIHHVLSHDARHYGFDVDVVGGGGSGGGGEGGVKMKFDYAKLKKHRDEYVTRLNKIYSDGFVSSGVNCIYGDCSFVDEHTVQVVIDNVGGTSGGETKRYTASKIVIATGGRPNLPSGEGISEYCITSDGFFDMEALPDVAVVVGAGYIAVELAGILNALGSEVHLVLRHDKPLRSFDPMLCDGIDVEMRRSGIFVHSHTRGVSKVVLDAHAGNSTGRKNVTLACGDVIYGADVVIMATGRMPNTEYLHSKSNGNGDDDDDNGIVWSGNTDGMGLEGCGVLLNSTGHVIVDEYQNTNVNGIYAIG